MVRNVRLNDWFEKGMTYEAYVDQMTVNKDAMRTIAGKIQLSEHNKNKLTKLKDIQLRAIALTEDWCGDAMVNNPILMKIADAANIEVRFLLRDQNLELMDQYLTNGKSRSIPIYIFLDKEGNEYAVWGPRAPEVQQFVDEERAKLPPKEAPDFEEKQKQMFRNMKKKFLEDEQVWKQIENSIVDRIVK